MLLIFFLIRARPANVPLVRHCGQRLRNNCVHFYIIDILACLSPLKTEEWESRVWDFLWTSWKFSLSHFCPRWDHSIWLWGSLPTPWSKVGCAIVWVPGHGGRAPTMGKICPLPKVQCPSLHPLLLNATHSESVPSGTDCLSEGCMWLPGALWALHQWPKLKRALGNQV